MIYLIIIVGALTCVGALTIAAFMWFVWSILTEDHDDLGQIL